MIERRRWVFDTNALVSRLLVPSGTAARAVDVALAQGVLLVSEATLAELTEVLWRPKFDPYLDDAQRRQFFSLLAGVSQVVATPHRIQACRDPKDDKFLDVALAGEAQAIITGDKDLRVLHPFHGIPIMTPAEFIAMPSPVIAPADRSA
jgi:putative PIN family toxin of toxin-antitoxin system